MRNITTTYRKDQYFLQLQGDEYLDSLCGKINAYRRYCNAAGLTAKWSCASRNYFGVSSDGSKTTQALTALGEDGGKIGGKVGEFRNLCQYQLVLTTNQRPAGMARAANTDSESLRSARIGTQLSEHLLAQKGWEDLFVKTGELGIVVDEGWFLLDWDAMAGEPVRPNPETGTMIHEGDIFGKVYAPWFMARDPYMQSLERPPWLIASSRENRWELIAQFPEHRDAILNAGTSGKLINSVLGSFFGDTMFAEYDSDYVFVHRLLAPPQKALEEGRLTLFVPDAVLIDGPFPYKEMNAYPMMPASLFDLPFGYSSASDVLGIEQFTDALHSIIATNQLSFGGNVIVGPQGAGIEHTQLTDALAYIETAPQFADKIRVLELLRTAPEVFNYMQMMSQKKRQLMGLNDAVMGDAENLKGASGAFAALLASQAIQFNSGVQKAWYSLLCRAMTGAINILREYADTERVTKIAGRRNAQYMKEFKWSGKDLRGVSTVSFEQVNPLSQTTAGLLSIAQDLISNGMIKSPKQYITLLTTGNLQALIQDDVTDEDCILAENEQLLEEGGFHKAVATENHADHIRSHMSVVTPEAKQNNPQLVARAMEAIAEHMNLWMDLSMNNPGMLLATGQQVLPVGPQMPPGGPGGPMPAEGGPGGPPPSEVMNGTPGPEQAAEDIALPEPAKSPLDGEAVAPPVPGI